MRRAAAASRPAAWLVLVVSLLLACSSPAPDEPSLASTGSGPTLSGADTTDTLDTTSTTQRQPLLYVAPNGADTNSGATPATALRTVERALELHLPGDTILLGRGTYPSIEVTGATDLSIRSIADHTAMVTADSYEVGPGVHVIDSTGVTISGLEVTRSLWGIVVEGSSEVVVANNHVHDLGQEGVMVRTLSSDVVVEGNTIWNTGNRPGGDERFEYATFGEGIYLGTGGVMDDGGFDTSSGLVVRGNEIHSTSAEAIDVKPSVTDVLVEGNHVHDIATNTSGAIVVGVGDRLYPDPQVRIVANIIHDISRTSAHRDGNAITISAPAQVEGNVVWNVEHYGVLIDENLRSEDAGRVVVRYNAFAGAGIAAIHERAHDRSIVVETTDNLVVDDLPAAAGLREGAVPSGDLTVAEATELARILLDPTSAIRSTLQG